MRILMPTLEDRLYLPDQRDVAGRLLCSSSDRNVEVAPCWPTRAAQRFLASARLAGTQLPYRPRPLLTYQQEVFCLVERLTDNGS